MLETLTEKIEKLLTPFLEEMGLDLVDFRVHRMAGQVTIGIFVDRPTGGITLLECTELNRRISMALDQQDWLTESYLLEVSSPGVDRDLRTKKDFLRVLSREIRVFLREPVKNKHEYAGILQSVEEEYLVLKADSGEEMIPIGKINKAKQIIHL
jgi:ribosome maturation factor RimP